MWVPEEVGSLEAGRPARRTQCGLVRGNSTSSEAGRREKMVREEPLFSLVTSTLLKGETRKNGGLGCFLVIWFGWRLGDRRPVRWRLTG